MRITISITALLLLFASVIVSRSADLGAENAHDSSGFSTEQSCYNYTFIDNNSIRGTMLDKEEMDSSPGKPDAVSYDTVRNLCKPNSKLQLTAIEKAGALDAQPEDTEGLSDENPILPDTQIAFIEEDKVNYDQFQSKETVFYGGVVPFVAVPDADLATDDHFFNPESFSLFLYFKKKF